MLTNKDIAFIQESREEIRENRIKEVTLIGQGDETKDPVTGEVAYEDISKDVNAVVTEVTLRTSVDRYRYGGIEIMTGDIVVDVSLDDFPIKLTPDTTTNITHRDTDYTVLTATKIGLGEDNRVELLGRRTI